MKANSLIRRGLRCTGILLLAPCSVLFACERYLGTYEVGIAGSQGKGIVRTSSVVTFSGDPKAITISMAPSTLEVINIDGGGISSAAFDAFEVTLKSSDDKIGWTFSDRTERANGYTDVFNLALGLSRLEPASLLLLREGSVDKGNVAPTTSLVSESCLRVEGSSAQWLFVRKGTRLVGVMVNGDAPATDIISKFQADPVQDISIVLKASPRFLRLSRLSLEKAPSS